MEANTAKRRKLDHTNGGPAFESPSTSTSAMGASGASAFVLETEELLKEVRVDYGKTFPGLDDTLRQFKDAIENLAPHEPLPIGDVSTKFEKTNRIAIPYPDPKPTKDSPYKLAWAKPTHVNLVGSYISKTMIKSQTDMAIDMIVIMPTSIFQEKDYVNLRYFYKRAYYLAYITAAMRTSFGSKIDFSFEYLNGNPLLPVLLARSKDTSSKGGESNSHHKSTYAIRIIPNAPEGYFPATKLSSISNAVRQGRSEDSKEAKAPTPFYNSTLKAESLFTPYLRLLHKTANTCPAFKDACILGRVWLQQRGFGSDISGGGFGHFEWAVLIALLLQGGGRKGEAILSPSLHSTQLFKATLQYLALTNLPKKPVVIGKHAPELEAIRQSGPVLYDADRELNVLFKMTTWSATMLCEKAKWSLSAINDSPLDQFDALFIVKVDQPMHIFDLLVKVSIPSSGGGFDATDRRGLVWNFSEKLYHTFRKALGERARMIHIEAPKTTTWPITATSPTIKRDSLLVGIAVDPVKASQGRDYGPSYELKKEAAKFREFWGERAELWQFPDGNIVESVPWTDFAPLGFPGICEAIIRYILKFRLKLTDNDLEFYGQDVSQIVPLMPSDKAAFDAARKSFEIFEQDIRDLEDLPLHVRQIAATAPALRHASVRTPEFNLRRQLTQPLDVVVSFEGSGKWPENLAAIQRLKIAFLLKLGSSLEESKEEIKTHLGLESASRDVENLAFLDVVYEEGVSFRLRVHSDQEEALLERQTKDKTVERHIRTEAADLLALLKRTYTNLPLHNQTILTFCTRFPALSPSIRLVKHFFNSHRLTCHFNEELIELFVLQAFLKPYPWQVPTSAMVGFLRTLVLLSRWDWREEPLIVDSSDSLSSSQRLEINTRLEAWRKIDPNMNRTVLFVATSHDVSGVAYTGDGPSKVVATRMTTLARSACKVVKEKGVGLDFRILFQSSLLDYNVLIHLSPKAIKAVQRDDETKHSHFKNLDERSAKEALPLVEAPAKVLLKRLRAMYSSPLLFSHGGDEDNIIAALWNPQLHSRTFTVNMPCSFKPVDNDEEMFGVNKEAILAEIARIGGDVIERVEVREGS